MMKLSAYAAILFQASLVFYSQPCSSQSSDDGKQQSEAERGTILAQQLKEAEKEMASVFNKAINFFTPTAEETREVADLPANERARQIQWDKQMLIDLRDSQKAWAAYRDISCRSIVDFYAEGSGAGNASTGCALQLTTDRTNFLRQFFSIQK